MKTPRAAMVRIADGQGAALTKEQKTFNRLTRKIAEQRKRLEAWQQTLPRYEAVRAQKLMPLLRELHEQRKPLVLYFDQVISGKGLSQRDKALLAELIVGLCALILREEDSAEFTAIHEYHGGGSADEERELQAHVMKSMMEDVFGMDMADHPDLDSPEALLAAFEDKMRSEQEHRQAQAAAHQAQRRERGKASAKALAAEARAKEEALGVSQSLREVYRKLASALHPDREPDADERARKTVLMQRVNIAYDGKDLLQLLELQLQVEQIDLQAIGNIGDAKLKHYNKVLNEQAIELQMELDEIEGRFIPDDPFNPPRLTPDLVMQSLSGELEQVRETILNIQADLREFQDIKALKAWLKVYRAQMGHQAFPMPIF